MQMYNILFKILKIVHYKENKRGRENERERERERERQTERDREG